METNSPKIIGNSSKLSFPVQESSIHLLNLKNVPLPSSKGEATYSSLRMRSKSQFNAKENLYSKRVNQNSRTERSTSYFIRPKLIQEKVPNSANTRNYEETKITSTVNTDKFDELYEEKSDISNNNALNSEISTLKTQIKELEKMNMNERRKYRDEISRLNEFINQQKTELFNKDEEIVKLNNRERNEDNMIAKTEFNKILLENNQMRKDYNSLKAEHEKLSYSYNSERLKFYQSDSKSSEIQNKILDLQKENKKLLDSISNLENLFYQTNKEKEMIYDYYNERKLDLNKISENNSMLENRIKMRDEELKDLKEKYNVLQEQYKNSSLIFSESQSNYKTIIKEKDEEIKKMKSDYEALRNEGMKKQEENRNIHLEYSEIKEKYKLESQRIKEIESRNETLEENIKSSNKQIESVKNELNIVKNEKSTLKQENEQLRNQFKKENSEIEQKLLSMSKSYNEIYDENLYLKRRNEQFNEEISKLKSILHESNKEISNLNETMNNLCKSKEIEKASWVDSLNSLNSQNNSKEREIQNLLNELSSKKNEINLKTQQIQDLKANSEALKSDNIAKANEIHNLVSKIESIEQRTRSNSILQRELQTIKEREAQDLSSLKIALESSDNEIKRLREQMALKEKEAMRSHDIKENILLELQKELLYVKRESKELKDKVVELDSIKAENVLLRARLSSENQSKKPLITTNSNLVESKVFDEEFNNELENTKIEVFAYFEDAENGKLGSSLLLSKDFGSLKESLCHLTNDQFKDFLRNFSPKHNFKKKDNTKENHN